MQTGGRRACLALSYVLFLDEKNQKSSQPRCFFSHTAFARDQVKPQAVIFLRLLSRIATLQQKFTMPFPAHSPSVLPALFRSCAAHKFIKHPHSAQ
jgi:hypothetical protein